MKFSISTEKKSKRPEFKPIEINIVLENPNDLFYLTAAFNLSHHDIMKVSDHLKQYKFTKPDLSYERFCALNELCDKWIEKCRKEHADVITDEDRSPVIVKPKK